MKIEKLNENKIKIVFNNKDLEENQITIHSFMSNSIENQALFLNILDIAEKEVGFVTDNYQIAIEALTQNKDDFTLIISRFNNIIKKTYTPKLHASRKLYRLENNISLFKFHSFETFLEFSKFILKNFPEINSILDGKNSLYKFDNTYFLVIDKIFFNKKLLFKTTCILSEFCDFINISDITFLKLKEYGNIIIDKFAIKNCA